MSVVAWDVETARFAAGNMAPPLVVVSWAMPSADGGKITGLALVSEAYPLVRAWLEDDSLTMVAHNTRYDLTVLCAEWPDLIPLVFRKYEKDLIADTEIRDKLIYIATGKFKGWWDKKEGRMHARPRFALDQAAKRWLGRALPKDDNIRLNFGALREVPISEWPPGFREYALDDSIAALDIYLLQEKAPPAYLVDQFRQVRADFWLGLTSVWGLRTHVAGVKALQAECERRIEEIRASLVDKGLVRSNGSRDMAAAYAWMERVCQENGVKVARNDPTERFPLGSVKLDEEACKASMDATMLEYAQFSTLGSILSKDIPLLASGTEYPIHTHFALAESGRTTSSKPNIQNFRRAPDEDEEGVTHGLQGIRECFIPRPGYVFAQADYPSLELRTLAQWCTTVLGSSTLAAALNADLDVHAEMAAEILGLSYDYVLENKRRHDIDNARQTGKVCNFGFPGGLGYKSLVLFAWASYKVRITEAQAKELKRVWLAKWPEMRDFFRYISELTSDNRPLVHLFTGRVRGGCTYTSACNSTFQGLGADCAKAAGWLVSRACYVDRSSPLFGSRIVNFVHDELILETPDTPEAHDAAKELERLMIQGANQYLPDVPFTAVEPVLMRVWSKSAKALYGPDGRLIPWAPKDIAA